MEEQNLRPLDIFFTFPGTLKQIAAQKSKKEASGIPVPHVIFVLPLWLSLSPSVVSGSTVWTYDAVKWSVILIYQMADIISFENNLKIFRKTEKSVNIGLQVQLSLSHKKKNKICVDLCLDFHLCFCMASYIIY